MADFLTAVKTVRSAPNSDPEPALKEVKTSRSASRPIHNNKHTERRNGDGLAIPQTVGQASSPAPVGLATPEDALRILRSQPGTEPLLATLRMLTSRPGEEVFSNFSLAAPGPLQSQIVNVLVQDTVPTFWPVLDKNDQALLIKCLHNVTGINALLAQLRALALPDVKGKGDGDHDQSGVYLEIIERVLSGDTAILHLWESLQSAFPEPIRRALSWKEIITTLGSGKIIATVAQAEDAFRKNSNSTSKESSWLASGAQFARWLGRNVATCSVPDTDWKARPQRTEAGKDAALLLTKALTLGYSNDMLYGLFPGIVRHGDEAVGELVRFVSAHVKKQLLERTVQWLSMLTLPLDTLQNSVAQPDKQSASASAALLQALASNDEVVRQHLVALLSDPVLTTSISHPVLRAALSFLSAVAPDDLQSLLERLLTIFSDQLFIFHAPVLQQESVTETLLLTAGYLYRQTPMAVLVIARSSNHLQGTSRRLDASGQRARWLGMVVAMAISGLVDKVGSRMDFGVEDVRTEEAQWYRDLVQVQDDVGSLADFNMMLERRDHEKNTMIASRTRQPKKHDACIVNGKPIFGPPRPPAAPPAQTEVIGEKVTEILDGSSEDEDDDLKPYAKPDSDPEDSDEDATLVNRNKPRAPVYIRDLMAMLREDKEHDRFQMGIKHAASLIRRKANFGKEVKDHAEELLSQLCNLQDPFDTEDFDELRLQAMIATLLSDVDKLAPWLSKHVFVEGYSLAQRCIMLSTLGLGGRELAGFKDEDALNPVIPDTDLLSKRLPPHLHAMYASSQNTTTKRLESASKRVEDKLIQPLALRAADQSTAHLNAVKVRTFSSRMAVERTKRKPAPNQLGKIFGSAFFFPLVSRYQQEVAAYGSASVFVSSPVVIVTFIKTLALLLHASGPATHGLSDLTAELWDLLLSLRVQASSNITILEAVLFSLLTLLEINTDKRRLAAEEPKRLAETQQWVEIVFERVGGSEMLGGSANAEEAKIRTLAAGVLVRLGEVGEVVREGLFGKALN